jgi:hypothetical protein
MMTNQHFIDDFGKYIEHKIEARNKAAKKPDCSSSLIDFLDREITFLESCEQLIICNVIEGEKALKKAKTASFALGIRSGVLQERTGRPHPEYLFS